MASERQFKFKTIFVATRGVREYRATIPVWVKGDDVVLEIGCEWGTTTALIAASAPAYPRTAGDRLHLDASLDVLETMLEQLHL